jgi:hypothetical protein
MTGACSRLSLPEGPRTSLNDLGEAGSASHVSMSLMPFPMPMSTSSPHHRWRRQKGGGTTDQAELQASGVQ